MSPHSDTLFLFRANQSWLLLLKYCVLSGEATNTNFIVFGFTQPGLEPTIYHTRGEHTYHYTTDVLHMQNKNEKTYWRMIIGKGFLYIRTMQFLMYSQNFLYKFLLNLNRYPPIKYCFCKHNTCLMAWIM